MLGLENVETQENSEDHQEDASWRQRTVQMENEDVLIPPAGFNAGIEAMKGLKSQGATGYLNTLLQTWYHLPYFRKSLYQMPTSENDVASVCMPLALQSLFYKMQYMETSVDTKDLTKLFGWDKHDSSLQHDVQELNRVLCEKLEDKMKGTAVEGTTQQLFEGHSINYIECINVEYKSTLKDSFYDLQLDVRGCKDVYESFDKYIRVEKLEGENRYHVERHGLQDARKGVLFVDFPPVLQLQLKRFEYDLMQNTVVKINDRYEFPLRLDLDRDHWKYISPDADRSVRNLYTLHSVLVHSGGGRESHYYAFIRPALSDQWYKFDDERVTKEEQKRALEDQYGGEEELPPVNPGSNNTPFKSTKCTNAYVLVYIRECDKDKIICNVDESDIAEHLKVHLRKEQETKKRKREEKASAHLYTVIKIGKDIHFDLVDHNKVRSYRMKKQDLFTHFKEEVAKELGIPVVCQRFWLWAKRENKTYRPCRPVNAQEELQTVGHLNKALNKASSADLKLFLEVSVPFLGQRIPAVPSKKTENDLLIFFKLYDLEKEELRYVGRTFVNSCGKPMDILHTLNHMAGFAPSDQLNLYEEIKFEPNVMCEQIDKKSTFRASQLEDGDIICYQKALSKKKDLNYRYSDVPSFLEYVRNRQNYCNHLLLPHYCVAYERGVKVGRGDIYKYCNEKIKVVHFRRLEKPKEDEFCLELSKQHTYDEVVEKVAQQLGLEDASKIRLTSHNCYSQQPKSQPIKYRGVDRLSDMLVHYNKSVRTSDILYIETLNRPLPELRGLKTLKGAFHNARTEELSVHNIQLPKQSTVGDVINELKGKVLIIIELEKAELSSVKGDLRIVEVFHHKIYKIFHSSEKIENINDLFWNLRAEEIPEEEKDLGSQDRLIHVYHFTRDASKNHMVQNFGEPFLLVVRGHETLVDVKERIRKTLLIADKEFVKWKFAFLSLGRPGPEYLQDNDVVASRFQKRDTYGAGEHYLGLEHADSAPKRSRQSNQNRHSFEKPVKIYS